MATVNTKGFSQQTSLEYLYSHSVSGLQETTSGAYQIVRNSNIEGIAIRISTGTVQSHIGCAIVVHCDANDKIYVRTHSTLQHVGDIVNDSNGWSMFAGWLLSR